MKKLMVAVVSVLATVVAFGVDVIDLTKHARDLGGDTMMEATASTCGSGLSPSNVIDGVQNVYASRWTSSNDQSQWLQIRVLDAVEPGKYISVTSYKFSAGHGWYGSQDPASPKTAEHRMPATWTLEGSDDGADWSVLDTRTNVTDWDAPSWMTKTFQVANPGSYRYYRFNFTKRNFDGDIQGDVAYQIGEIDLSGKVLLIPDEEEKTLTWCGGTSGDWNEAANWQAATGENRLPAEGDIVSIPANMQTKVTLAQSTPHLLALTIGSYSGVVTLETSGWNTCIEADNLKINGKGVVTCVGGGTDVETVSRVWLKGQDITIAAGGMIDVSKLGYAGPAKTTVGNTYATGYGPAGGLADHGAAHGGFGGRSTRIPTIKDWNLTVMPADDPAYPAQPGSSGAASSHAPGRAGGGAVRIEATGCVTVNGEILANGEASGGYSTAAGQHNGISTAHETAGAGGAVWISCETFAGRNGVIRAEGGGGDGPTGEGSGSSSPGQPAGGGMIAIHYDTAKQTDGLVSGMVFSVAPGFHGWNDTSAKGYALHQMSAYDRDAYLCESADLGTLWFSDEKMLESLGTGITGQVLNMPPSLTLPSLNVTAGWFRFAQEGFTLNVTGDLTISGKTACYEVGGVTPTNRTFYTELYGKVPAHLNVGGSLTVLNQGRLDVRSADTNETVSLYGAFVNVAGEMKVDDGGVVYVWADSVGGAVPRFDVGSLTVAEGGLLSANCRGYAGGHAYSSYPIQHANGYGPGAGVSRSHTYIPKGSQELFSYVACGAGHGGLGGWQEIATGAGGKEPYAGIEYDDAYGPCAAGSGGAGNNWGSCGGSGGGAILVWAAGTIRVDGEINADGGTASGLRMSGGAGGTIRLSCSSFVGAETGILSAKGERGGPGNTSNDNATWTTGHPEYPHKWYMMEGAGAGGRIAIRTGLADDCGKRLKIRKSMSPFIPEGEAEVPFRGTMSVAGGVNPGGNLIDVISSTGEPYGVDLNGRAGTIRYLDAIEAPGVLLMVR